MSSDHANLKVTNAGPEKNPKRKSQKENQPSKVFSGVCGNVFHNEMTMAKFPTEEHKAKATFSTQVMTLVARVAELMKMGAVK